jgi:N-acyl-D-amino-acid deacylase
VRGSGPCPHPHVSPLSRDPSCSRFPAFDTEPNRSVKLLLPSSPRLVSLLAAAAVLAACATPEPAPPSPDPAPAAIYDLVIANGRVVDGTGNAWFYGDVAFLGDRIARVEPAGVLSQARARERIDATGKVVAPGFIDIQSHARSALLTGDPRLMSKVTQGITTEIMGEGTTNAPLPARALAELDEMDDGEERALVRSFVGQGGFDAWLRAMEARGPSTNIGSYVGATSIRTYGMDMAMGEAGPAELDSMRTAVRWAMEEGAFGIASALIYPPGNYATTDELVEISRVMAAYGGHYITHMRSEADRLLEATDEAIEIGRRAGVPVEIYHLKAAGVRNHPLGEAVIAKIDSARAEGLDVQANMYPYVAGGTGLTACFPPWASEGGRLFENLEDLDTRERIRAAALEDAPADWENLCALATPSNVLVLGLERPEHEHFAGRRLSEIAAEMGTDWVEAAIRLLVAERQRIGTIYFLMSEENVRLKLQQPWMKFGTDAGGIDPETATGGAHPRAYGTYPRILGKYVREEGVLSLEEAVRKASSAVATRLSIPDRGLLRPGMFADVVVFDPETIRDRSTFEDPHQLSVGVEHVFVNGTAVVRDGSHTGAGPGRIVRGPGYRGER